MQRALVWPYGNRVAVVASVLLETGSEGKAPSYLPCTTPLPAGSKDTAGINWSRFGGRPAMTTIFRQLVEHLRGQKGVSFASHHQVAKWIGEQKFEDMSYATRFCN